MGKGDFLGRASTLQRKLDGIETELVYAEISPGDCDARGGEPVFSGSEVIGVTTSGGFGHATGKSLVFAYVPPAYAASNTAFDIEILGVRRRASVLAEPVWDPRNDRLRG